MLTHHMCEQLLSGLSVSTLENKCINDQAVHSLLNRGPLFFFTVPFLLNRMSSILCLNDSVILIFNCLI